MEDDISLRAKSDSMSLRKTVEEVNTLPKAPPRATKNNQKENSSTSALSHKDGIPLAMSSRSST